MFKAYICLLKYHDSYRKTIFLKGYCTLFQTHKHECYSYHYCPNRLPCGLTTGSLGATNITTTAAVSINGACMYNEHIVRREQYLKMTSYDSLYPVPVSWQYDTVKVKQFYVIGGN